MSEPPGTVRPAAARALLSACFCASGCAALLYQVVWLRLALAQFGVNTSVVATVLAVFMLGLATGSLSAARCVARAEARFGVDPLRFYGLAEIVIGIGGAVVPSLLTAGRQALLAVGPASGALYSIGTTAILTAILLPFCTAMGLTFPAAIAFLKRVEATGPGRDPFSALYLANVLGAVVGAVATPLVLIELYGFVATCRGAALVNAAIGIAALTAFRRGRRAPVGSPPGVTAHAPALVSAPERPDIDPDARVRRLTLFATGFTTMGMEVVWSRIYPTVIGTFVYSFAAIVALYLVATTVGSLLYRRLRHRRLAERWGLWLPLLCVTAFLPLLSASMTLPPIAGVLRVFIGVAPFCAILGFLTPALVDREAGDDPARVGRAYAINLAGCLLGPIVAGFVLLPTVGARGAALALALPLFLLLVAPPIRRHAHAAWILLALGASAAVWFSTTLFEERFPAEQVRHDHVATVVAAGTGLHKQLYVNGVGMTELTTITKLMAHLPAAHLTRRTGEPLDTLVVCFGMGTSFRSLAAWGANVTAVELVPSVPELFDYYFPGGAALVRNSGGRLRIIQDDGRRFLDRTADRFDIITIDPPPPVEAAGSSLLYSKEFYASARRKMKPGAILQTWLPGGDRETVAGVTLSALESFGYVRVFASFQGFGFHVLASDAPIPHLTATEAAERMPAAAVRDLGEWIDAPPAQLFESMLAHEYAPESLLTDHSRAATLAISDDRPVNEFYLLRRMGGAQESRPAYELLTPPAGTGPPR